MARLSQGDIARRVNRRIYDFVHRSANRKLLPGTGYYSTPFRGGLFGETESDAVAKRLSGSECPMPRPPWLTMRHRG